MKTNNREPIKATLPALFLTFAGLLATSATAQVNYAVSGGTAYVTSSPNAAGNIVIDATYNGFPVTRIANQAFNRCTNLASVTIPNSITNIEPSAFRDSSLTSVTIPSSVTVIGFSAFSSCTSLTNILVDSANSVYSSLDGVLFNKTQTILIQFPGGRGGSYSIPNSVTNFIGLAFRDCSLTSVTIPNSITTIESAAFSGCRSLTNVTIPNSVASIGQHAFSVCTNLRSVTIPDSVTTIGFAAFGNCTSLTNISVDSANSVYSSLDGILFNKTQGILIQFPSGRGGSYVIPNSVTSFIANAFANCRSLTSATIPNSVTSIGDGTFFACSSLTNVTIGSSVTSIGQEAFEFCTSLRSVTIPNNVTNLAYAAFRDCTSLTNATIGNGVIGQEAFYNCTNLRSVTIGNGVSTIVGHAFYYCSSLTSVTIPSSVTSIGLPVFNGCTSLTNITVAAANPYYSSLNGVLFDKAQSILIEFPDGRSGSYVIPNTVASIWNEAFEDCTSLTSVTIPSSVTFIGDEAFRACTGLTNITVAAANSTYSSLNGALFNKAKTTLIQFPCGRGGSFVISDSVTNLAHAAFYNCTNLASVTLGDSVTSIGDYAFFQCTSLTNISVNSANTAYSSLNGILFNKAQTTLIQFPATRGGSYVIPNGVTTIGAYSFYQCPSLTSVTIPNSITSIKVFAFAVCPSLTSFTFAGNRPSLEGAVFYLLGAGATVYYYYGTIGWGLTYGGLPTVMLGAPAPQVAAASTGAKQGGFGFTITGVTNQTIVVEASTNLVNWRPVWTGTLSALSTNFIDPDSVNHPHRFYRAQSY
ncbi:MAG TPA: leucine-rich repeat domain-containing protein [Verrucomicrobiae bacterium]|nr:leucine-rich repeat domain-containing protein [Verrucomicrobiae bacterium]